MKDLKVKKKKLYKSKFYLSFLKLLIFQLLAFLLRFLWILTDLQIFGKNQSCKIQNYTKTNLHGRSVLHDDDFAPRVNFFTSDNFLRKFNSPVCKSGSSIPYLRKQIYHYRSLSFLAMSRKEIPRKVLMVCALRKKYVSKLKIILERFATQQNQLPSFHLRTQIALIKANPLIREIVYCFILSLMMK